VEIKKLQEECAKKVEAIGKVILEKKQLLSELKGQMHSYWKTISQQIEATDEKEE
jgi:hypothetical protein